MKSFAAVIGTSIPEALKVLSIPSAETIHEASLVLGMQFGPQLLEYLLTYGAIAFGTVEFNGITESKKNNSSLVRNTVFLRDAFPGMLSRLVVLEDRGDGEYVLCDELDHIWHFIPETSFNLLDSECDLTDYTLKRSQESK